MVYFSMLWNKNNVLGLSRFVMAPFVMICALGVFWAHAAAVANEKQPLSVTIDNAKVVRIGQAADTIIIGNPSIIDATIQDARTIVLTGRNYGVTNLIILDENGGAIVDETVIVKGHKINTVQVFKQASRETFTCSPTCERTLAIGDNNTAFSLVQSQVTGRNAMASSNSEGQ